MNFLLASIICLSCHDGALATNALMKHPEIQCEGCHTAHTNPIEHPANKPFLRKTLEGSELCYLCHDK